MTDATAPLTSEIPITSNGTPNDAPEDDTFERDLKKMLQDGPNLNNSSAVQGGSGTTPTTVAPTPFSGVRLNSPTAPSQQQRSPTGPVPPPNPYVGSRLASTLKPPQYQAPGSTQELEDYEADEFGKRGVGRMGQCHQGSSCESKSVSVEQNYLPNTENVYCSNQ